MKNKKRIGNVYIANSKRLLSFVLCVALVVSLCAVALAAELPVVEGGDPGAAGGNIAAAGAQGDTGGVQAGGASTPPDTSGAGGNVGTGGSGEPQSSGTVTPGSTPDSGPAVPTVTITAFDALDAAVMQREVAAGTSLADLKLPEKLSGTADGAAADIPVKEWKNAQDTPTYDPATAGTYTFEPVFDAPYTVSGAALPQITVTVKAAEPASFDSAKGDDAPSDGGEQQSASAATLTVTAFAELAAETQFIAVETGTEAKDVPLPQTLDATATLTVAPDGADAIQSETTLSIPVTWECKDYDPLTPGEYKFTANLPSTLPASVASPSAEDGGADIPLSLADGVTPPEIYVQVGGGALMAPMMLVQSVDNWADLVAAVEQAKDSPDPSSTIEITASIDAGAGVAGNYTLDGGNKDITLLRKTTGHMIRVPAGASLTLANITLDGNNAESAYTGNANGALVRVSGGTFTMNAGATLQNNTRGAGTYNTSGGAVNVSDGAFTMAGGSITANSSARQGGGVYVNDCPFTMSGGSISGNSAVDEGKDVFIENAQSSSALTLSGTPRIGSAGGGGVYRGAFSKITVDGTEGLSVGASIFVEAVLGDAVNTVVATKAADFTDLEMLEIFHYMGAGFDFIADNSQPTSQLKLQTSGYTTLQAAINAATGGTPDDPVLIRAKDEVITEPVTVSHSDLGTARHVKIVGAKLTRGFRLGDLIRVPEGSTLVLEDVMLDGQKATYATAEGGLVRVYGKVTLGKGAVLQNNSSTVEGGAIRVRSSGECTLGEGAVLQDNYSYLRGGGVWIFETGKCTLAGGTVQNNVAQNDGGGIYCAGKAFQMTAGKITGNVCTSNDPAYGAGGGVFIGDPVGDVTLSGGEISGNTALTGAGLWYGGNPTLKLSGVVVKGNDANLSGGGIYMVKGTLNMTDGEISGNTAKESGGGICITRGAITMEGGEISGNTAAWDGGGICLSVNTMGNSVTCSLQGGRISGNYAGNSDDRNGGGGGIGVIQVADTAVRCTLAGATVSGNTTDGRGGGISMDTYGIATGTTSTLDILSGSISGNTATGKGQEVVFGPRTTLRLFGEPTIGSDTGVGGVYNDGGSITVLDTGLTGGYIALEQRTAPDDAVGTLVATRTSGSFTDTEAGYFHYKGIFGLRVNPGNASQLVLRALSLQERINAAEGGSAANPVEIALYQGETISQPVVIGNWDPDANGGAGDFIDATPRYVKLTGAVTLTRGCTGDLITVSSGSMMVLENIVVDGAKAAYTDADGSLVKSSGTFTMNAGAVLKNNATTGSGGGAHIAAGSFAMLGGTIGGSGAGNSATNGGGVYVAGGNFMIQNTAAAVSHNAATGTPGNGGGVYIAAGTLGINGGNISNNTAAGSGGGVYYTSDSALTVGNGGIRGNSAAGSGGGLYIDSAGACGIENASMVQSNTATGDGGGVYKTGTGTLTVNSSTIGGINAGNGAVNGGGVYIAAGALGITSGSINNNTASGNGGGVYYGSGNTFTLSGGYIRGNNAAIGGGLYFNSGGAGSIENAGMIQSNTATGNGGGIYVTGTGTFSISNGTIGGIGAGNSATSGGGVYVAGGGFTMNGANATISRNAATGTANTNGGGGVFFNSSGTFTMSNGSIANNTANGGSGSAGACGGGVYVNAGSMALSGGAISGNAAASGGGGGVFFNSSVTLNMSGGTIGGAAAADGNSAVDGGGVFLNGGSLTLSGTAAVSGNTATGNGGGVCAAGGTTTLSGGSITGNSGLLGSGVYVDAAVQLSGAPTFDATNTNGLYIAAESKAPTITAPLTGSIPLEGIPYADPADMARELVIATNSAGYTVLSAADAEKFSVTGGGYTLGRNAGNTAVVAALTQYTIGYTLDMGLTHNNPLTYTVLTPDITLADPVGAPVGLVFDGWYDAAGNKVTSIPKGSMGNLSLTARLRDTRQVLVADPDGNAISMPGGDIYAGEPFTFTANGSLQNAWGGSAGPGSTCYIPFAWEVNPSGTWNPGGPYTATATVDAAGQYTLKVSFAQYCYDGSAWSKTGSVDTKSIPVTVQAKAIPISGITPGQPNTQPINIPVGGTTQLTVVVVPDNATNKAVTWTSSNPAVITVDTNGLVTGVGPGTATITATTEDGGFAVIWTVAVAAESGVTTTTDSPVSPSTGDGANLCLWFALCLIAATSIISVVVYRRRKIRQ